ncbi:MAG: hypothetical protein LBB53_03965 [Prevotellaceae bacterium]|jgi:hypothetical protein|nr:hypothetical protein [Prevotellaceae bacterium]
MKYTGIILAMLLFCTVSFASTKGTQENSKDTTTSKAVLTVRLDSASLDKALRKITGVAFIIDTKNQIVSVTYPNDRKTAEALNKLKKKVDAVLVSYVPPKAEAKSVEQWTYDPKIDKWLNIEDESIFTDNFMPNVLAEQVNPNRRQQFLLVKNIHDYAVLLTQVDEERMSLAQRKNKLSDAKAIFETVNETNAIIISPLSKSQKDFFKHQAQKYERLYKELYGE